MTINFGNVSGDYAKYRDDLPAALFEQLSDRGIIFKDLSVADLGSGSGIFSRDLAKQGAYVTGIEPSGELIQEAVALDKLLGLDKIQYIHSCAEDFDAPGTFQIVTAVRAWHWFDRIKVIEKIKKYLDPNGLLIIINSIFLPDSEVSKITFDVLINNKIELKPAGSNAEAKARRNGFPVNWFEEWASHSLQLIHEWEYQYTLQFTHEEWCGKIRSVSWMTNVEEDTRKKVTDELMKRLSDREAILNIPHKLSVAVLRHDM